MSARSLACAALLLGGCDAAYGGFLGAAPVPDDDPERVVDVVIGIDGLSRAAFDRARAAGSFADYAVSDLVTFFPGVSDYSWTRMLRTGPMPGYEVQHYDPAHNEIVGQGLAGVFEHPLRQGLLDPLPCYRRFDFLGDGDLWMLNGYVDPEAALPTTMNALFDALVTRGRRQPTFLAYLVDVDVLSHKGGLDRVVAMLIEVDRRLRAFQQRHPGRFTFTLVADHGNAHRKSELIDPRDLLRDVGVTPVDHLSDGPVLEAAPIVHVRVNFVTLHTHPAMAPEVAARASRHRWVDLVAAPLGDGRFGVWKAGALHAFRRASDGSFTVEDPDGWADLGLHVPARLSGADALALTAGGPYPDIFYRVATAFTDRTVDVPGSAILSLREDVASFGFHLPGTEEHLAVDGFHGALARASTMTVVASQAHALPSVVRADELADLLPPMRPRR